MLPAVVSLAAIALVGVALVDRGDGTTTIDVPDAQGSIDVPDVEDQSSVDTVGDTTPETGPEATEPGVTTAPEQTTAPEMTAPETTASATTAAPETTAAPSSSVPGVADDWPARRLERDPMAHGDVDAPLVLVEYADFQCGFCGRFARETLPKLMERYVDQGLLRIEWRDLPFLGDESWTASHAGVAAGMQGKFWEFYDAVYGVERTKGSLTQETLIQIATDIGLDVDQFNIDRALPSTIDLVNANLREATSIGFTSTPSFVIERNAIVGAQPFEAFEQLIDSLLAEQ